jgi:hypothetical protein
VTGAAGFEGLVEQVAAASGAAAAALASRRPMPERFTVAPRAPKFWRLSQFTLGLLLVGVIITGAGVRLTRSGLGCPGWPRCHGSALPPLQINSIIGTATACCRASSA